MKYSWLLLIALSVANVEENTKIVAVITVFEGNVKIFRGKTEEIVNVCLLDGFFEGDSIKIEVGGKATILYNDGRIITINEAYNNEITAIPRDTIIGQTEDKKLSAGICSAISSLFDYARKDKEIENKITTGREADSFNITVYNPGNTALTEGRPIILWCSYPEAQYYTALIQKRDSVIMSVTTVDTFSSYLETKEEELAPGSYFLKVSAFKNADFLKSAKRIFKILDPEEIDRINKVIADIKAQNLDTFTFHLLCAEVFKGQGLKASAIKEYQVLHNINQTIPCILHNLYILYNEIGQPEIGNEYLVQYEKLITGE